MENAKESVEKTQRNEESKWNPFVMECEEI